MSEFISCLEQKKHDETVASYNKGIWFLIELEMIRNLLEGLGWKVFFAYSEVNESKTLLIFSKDRKEYWIDFGEYATSEKEWPISAFYDCFLSRRIYEEYRIGLGRVKELYENLRREHEILREIMLQNERSIPYEDLYETAAFDAETKVPSNRNDLLQIFRNRYYFYRYYVGIYQKENLSFLFDMLIADVRDLSKCVFGDAKDTSLLKLFVKYPDICNCFLESGLGVMIDDVTMQKADYDTNSMRFDVIHCGISDNKESQIVDVEIEIFGPYMNYLFCIPDLSITVVRQSE